VRCVGLCVCVGGGGHRTVPLIITTIVTCCARVRSLQEKHYLCHRVTHHPLPPPQRACVGKTQSEPVSPRHSDDDEDLPVGPSVSDTGRESRSDGDADL
jgi:hypothetical protein